MPVPTLQSNIDNHFRPLRSPEPIQSDDEDEALDHVLVAIDKTSTGTIGCAHFVAREGLLRCMEDMDKAEDDIIHNLILELQPTTLLLSSRLADFKLTRSHDDSSVADFDSLPYELIRRPASEFRYENALRNLNLLRYVDANRLSTCFLVPGNDVDAHSLNQADGIGLTNVLSDYLEIGSILNLDNKISVGCLGALVSLMQKRRDGLLVQNDGDRISGYEIGKLEMFTLKKTMLISADTFASLQIIQPESHPNAAKQGPGVHSAKESLSVYGLFYRYTRTPQGRARLRSWFLQPSLDIAIITDRLDMISVCVRPQNHTLIRALSKSLSKIKNLRGLLRNLKKGSEAGRRPVTKIKSTVWATILEFCYHSIDINTTLRDVAGHEQIPLCVKAIEVLDRNILRQIGSMIYDTVDLDLSADQGRTVIKRNVHEDLDKVKDVHDRLEDTLSDIAKELTNTMPDNIALSLNVVFLPQLGFHIAVPRNPTSSEPMYDGGHEVWERRFLTSDHVYMKNHTMRELDFDLGDLWTTICDAEIEISYKLAQQVLVYEDQLMAASDLCGELDCLLAFAHGAIEYKLARPEFVTSNIIHIRQGRHLLQEMIVPTFIPNDTRLAGGDESSSSGPSMIMLTGPNYSGKSVYQKQVALIVFMAHIGSFVPAEAATLGITDKILTRVATRETVSKIQSAFMIDLQQISRALNTATERSLLLIDEFGKGTDTCDGAGLTAAVLRHLLCRDTTSPKVIASTHFHEIFETGSFDMFDRFSFACMNLLVTKSFRELAAENDCQVTYLYDLQSGRSTASYGTQCAALNGIPRPIIKRAEELVELSIRGEDLVSACVVLPSAELEELEIAQKLARKFLSLDFDIEMNVDNLLKLLDNECGSSDI